MLRKIYDNAYGNNLLENMVISKTFNVFDLCEYHSLDKPLYPYFDLRFSFVQVEGIGSR